MLLDNIPLVEQTQPSSIPVESTSNDGIEEANIGNPNESSLNNEETMGVKTAAAADNKNEGDKDNEDDEDDDEEESSAANQFHMNSGLLPFPEKLMSLLDGGKVPDAMWWLPDGDAFCLIPVVFAERVLDKYFQGTKFESFTRKLNRWYVA